MGRKVRRVHTGFEWPLGEIWQGFVMPDRLIEDRCDACDSTGYGPSARAVANTFYPHMIGGPNAYALAWHDKIGQAEVDHLIEQGRLRVWRGKWVAESRTAEEVNAEQQGGLLDSHDAINRGILIRFRCERLGIPLYCPECEGHGTVERYPGQREEAEAWAETEPPEGEGWQVWETVTEGSPITPVFSTAEELAEHMAAEMDYDYDTALRFVKVGWAPSFMSDSSGVVDGVEAVGGMS